MRFGSRVAAACALLALMGGSGARAVLAQTRSLGGTVTEAGSSRRLGEVQVVVFGSGLMTLSDSNGSYAIAGLPAGRLEIRVRRIGYAPLVRFVEAAQTGPVRLDLAMSPAVTELAPVVVTATREERSLADVPAAVSVADSFTIKNSRSAGLHEVLRFTPGVQATSRYGLDDVNLSIRGSGIRTTFGVRGVAVLIDGVPITEPDGLTRLDLIELGAARQVEVVRGPASAVYGGVASGGAINIISRSGAESRGLNLRAQRGSFGFQKYDGSVGATFAGDRGSVYLSGAYTDSRGFREANTNEMLRLNFRGDYRPAEHTRVAFEASTSDLDMRIPGALNLNEFDTAPYSAVADPNVVNRYARRDERFRTGVRLDQRVTLGRPVETMTYAFYGGRTLDHPIFQVLDQDLHRVQLGTRLRAGLDRATSPRLRATAGIDYDNLFGTDRRYVNAGGERGAIRADGYMALPNVGIYAQTEAMLGQRITLTGGARYDRVTYHLDNYLDPSLSADPTFAQLSPKGTATYRVNDGTSLYASVARGFEVPSSGEIAVSPNPGESFNTALEPKTLVNYEVGVKSLLAQRIFVDLAVFRANVHGEFLSRTVATEAGPRSVFENAGRSRQTGVELGWTVLAADWLDVVGSYTFADFKLTDFSSLTVGPDGRSTLVDFSGNRLPGVPQHRLAGELRLRPAPNLSAGVGAEWQSRMFVDNANADAGVVYFKPFGPGAVQQIAYTSVPAFALVHLNASYRWRGTTLFASLENVFNKRYIANVTINDGQGRFYGTGAGRYLAVGVALSAFSGGF
jgi:iron complex outermembrane receptor protein